MRPVLIGIAGAGSGAGKTAFAEVLLESLPGWGAIKFTRTEIYTSVIEEMEVLLEEGKDTARLFRAGAEKVVWVQSPGGEDLEEALSLAVSKLATLRGILIEGNSAVEVLNPDIVIFIGAGNIKDSARHAFEMARIVLVPEGGLDGWDAGGKVCCRSARECAGRVLEILDEIGK